MRNRTAADFALSRDRNLQKGYLSAGSKVRTLQPPQARARHRPCLPHRELCRTRSVLSRQCRPALAAAPMRRRENGLCPIRRNSRKASQSKRLSRSTGVAVTRKGDTRPSVPPSKSREAKAGRPGEDGADPSSRQYDPNRKGGMSHHCSAEPQKQQHHHPRCEPFRQG